MSREVFTGNIAIGQRVHCILYGGSDGTVVAIHGTQNPGSCRGLGGGVGVTGGNCDFDIIWDEGRMSPRTPECLLRVSVQWKVYSEVYTEEQIAEVRARLTIATARRNAEAAEAEARFRQECNLLRAEYPWLKQAAAEPSDFKRGIANIRILLKQQFPKVKFSVRSDHQSTGVRWTDGPTCQQVEHWVMRFKSGQYDAMADCHTFKRTPWNTVFGDSRYISTQREYSDELLCQSLDKLYELLPQNLMSVPRPEVSVLRSYGYASPIPHLNLTIAEGARAIAEAFDATSCKFHLEGYSRYGWLIEPLLKPEEQGRADSVTPSPTEEIASSNL